MDVTSGYKRTEVGVIPEDWDVARLPDVAHFRAGKAHEQFVDDGGRFVCVNSKFISTEGKIEKRCTENFCPAKPGDVLMVMSDLPNGKALAKAFLVGAKDSYAVNQRVCALSPRTSDSAYLYYILNRNPYFLAFDNGVSQTHLLNHVFESCPLPLPSNRDEQAAIGTALSDADALIESLEQLLAKKRRLKLATMQELLTGRRRLPGFTDNWNEEEIHSLIELLMDFRGRTPKKLGLEWGGGDIRALSAGNVKMGRIDYDEESYFGSEELYRRWMTKGETKRGDVLVTTEAPLGNVAMIPDEAKYILSQRTILLRANADLVIPQFLFHVLASSAVQDALRRDSSGTTATGIQRLRFERLRLSYPTVKEQKSISDVLADIDQQIHAVGCQLKTARQLKQGMMQELLTGRIRLV